MDGYEVARQLQLAARTDGGQPRLIALTGYGQEADRQRARDAGFLHHLVKPIDLDHLRRVLSTPLD
jgi:CheY-like chemotaxis protein